MSTAENVTPGEGYPFSDSPTARLPRTVAGLSHREIAIRARGIIAAADQRFRASTEPDIWDRRMNATGVLSKDDQRILIAATRLNSATIPDEADRADLDDRCRELLVAAVRKLVMKEAWRLAGATHVTSREARYGELVALGETAVLEQIDQFDLTADASFATYVSWWTYQAMQRHTYLNSSPAYVPEHIQVGASRLHNLLREYEAENRHPSVSEIAEEMSVRSGAPVTVEHVRRMRAALRGRYPVSLDGEVRVFDGARRVEGPDAIPRPGLVEQPDTSLRDPDANLQAADVARDVRSALDEAVSDDQAQIIRARFGIDTDELSPEEVQAQMGISKGSYDGLKERGERALALHLAIRHRPGYVAQAMAEMEPDDAQVLRMAHGLDFSGARVADPLSHAEIAAQMGTDPDAIRRTLRQAERQAAMLMTRTLPGEHPRRHMVDDAGELTPGP